MKSIELKEKRAEILESIDALLEKIQNSEERSATDEQLEELKALREQRTKLEKEIVKAELFEEEQREAEKRNAQKTANVVVPGPLQDNASEEREREKLMRSFSYTKAIRAVMKRGGLDGAEREMSQEAEKEARAIGKSIEGVGLPSWALYIPGAERRSTWTVGTANSAGDLVQTSIRGHIPYLYPAMVLDRLGVTFMTGLTDNLDLTRDASAFTAAWENEGDQNADGAGTVNKLTLTPKRLGAKAIFSKKLAVQSSLSVENHIRQSLNIAVGQKLESDAINGSGSGPVPIGILNTPGIGDEAIGANGGAPTWAAIVKIEGDVDQANALMENLAYLTTPRMRSYMKAITKDSGSGRFLVEGNTMNGYNVIATSNVPDNLTKGISNDCHAIIFGNWAELIVAQWGPLDLVIDPYTRAEYNEVVVVVNSHWDIGVKHAASFSAIQDARVV